MRIMRCTISAIAAFMLSGCAMSGISDGNQKLNTYEVFFDLGRSNIGETSAEIIQQVALSAKQQSITSINLTVHADNTGRDTSGQTLSERRAAAVKAELIKGGVAADKISYVHADASSQTVATRDGIYEPQNRRIEITLK